MSQHRRSVPSMSRRDEEDRVHFVSTTVQKTYEWLDEIADATGVSRSDAYHILRSSLHVLRDRLIIDEVADLGAQLPILVRGVYYDAWNPSKNPQKMDATEYVARFIRNAQLEPEQEPVATLQAATDVLRRHVTAGEMEDVLSSLPADIRRLLVPSGQAI